MKLGLLHRHITLGGKDFRFTAHAVSRALDMGVHPAQILRALETPDCTYTDGGDTVFRSAEISLPCERDRGVFVVKTVLWATDDGWTRDLAISSYEGREVKA